MGIPPWYQGCCENQVWQSLLSAQHLGGTEGIRPPFPEAVYWSRTLRLGLAPLPTCPDPTPTSFLYRLWPWFQLSVCFLSQGQQYPQRVLGISLEMNLFDSAMMPGVFPTMQTLPCSELRSFVTHLDILHWSWCGSASSWGCRVPVNWQCPKCLLSFLPCMKLLLFWALVNLLKIRWRLLTVARESVKCKYDLL